MRTIAFALCGSFCTFENALKQLARLRETYEILPVMSETAYNCLLYTSDAADE